MWWDLCFFLFRFLVFFFWVFLCVMVCCCPSVSLIWHIVSCEWPLCLVKMAWHIFSVFLYVICFWLRFLGYCDISSGTSLSPFFSDWLLEHAWFLCELFFFRVCGNVNCTDPPLFGLSVVSYLSVVFLFYRLLWLKPPPWCPCWLWRPPFFFFFSCRVCYYVVVISAKPRCVFFFFYFLVPFFVFVFWLFGWSHVLEILFPHLFIFNVGIFQPDESFVLCSLFFFFLLQRRRNGASGSSPGLFSLFLPFFFDIAFALRLWLTLLFSFPVAFCLWRERFAVFSLVNFRNTFSFVCPYPRWTLF